MALDRERVQEARDRRRYFCFSCGVRVSDPPAAQCGWAAGHLRDDLTSYVPEEPRCPTTPSAALDEVCRLIRGHPAALHVAAGPENHLRVTLAPGVFFDRASFPRSLGDYLVSFVTVDGKPFGPLALARELDALRREATARAARDAQRQQAMESELIRAVRSVLGEDPDLPCPWITAFCTRAWRQRGAAVDLSLYDDRVMWPEEPRGYPEPCTLVARLPEHGIAICAERAMSVVRTAGDVEVRTILPLELEQQ